MVSMTKKIAKELSLEVWRYLAEHPWIRTKEHLPRDLYERIKFMMNLCPLCELSPREICKGPECPLKSCKGISPYTLWAWAKSDEERKENAQIIVKTIEAWEPEEY